MDSFVREHVVEGDEIADDDLWCSVSWRPNVGLPGNCLAAVSKDGVVMILSQDADGMSFYVRQRWSVGEGQRLAWTKAGTLLAVVANVDKCFLFKESSGGEWKEVASIDGEPNVS